MARECRFNRRLLSRHIYDVVTNTPKFQKRAKIIPSPSGIIYVLLISKKECDREERRGELGMRCLIVRGKFRTSSVVVGLATEHYDSSGHSFDACHLKIEKWTKENQLQFDRIQKEFTYFESAKWRREHIDEYPSQNDN